MSHVKRKPGRPKQEITKDAFISARLTKENEAKINLLSIITKKSKTELLLDGLNMLYEKYLKEDAK